MFRIFVGVAVMIAALCSGLATQAAFDAEHQSLPKRLERPARGRFTGAPLPPAVNGADPETTGEIVLVVAYLDALERERLEVIAYLDALEESRLAAVAEANRVAAARAVAAPQPARGGAQTQVSGVCGGATNGADQFIARESGGNPNVYNAGGSGAWGCYQVMPGTWASSCSDLGQYGSASPAQQAACASRLPLSAWGG